MIKDDDPGVALTSKEELGRAALADRHAQAKMAGRRASTTASKCATAGCNIYHYLPTGMCAIHSGLKKEVQTVFHQKESTRLEDLRADLSIADHYAVLGQLRSEMLSVAQTFDNSTNNFVSLKTEASTLLKGFQLDDVEKGQLLSQFRRLDINQNGLIDATDLLHLIAKFDEDFLKDITDTTEKERKVAQWIQQVNDDQPTMTLIQYVNALINHRKACNQVGAIAELNRFAFWDLRSIMLSSPTVSKKNGWLLKRGYFFSKENLNSWEFRYFELEGTMLNYYTTVPGATTNCEGKVTEHKLLKTINLLECAVVDFSPKTIAPEDKTTSMDSPTVFKVTTYYGKRFTLATSREDAIQWVALLSWYSTASKEAFTWRANFGSVRKIKITLRDYIMLGCIIAKIMRGLQALEKDPQIKDTKEYEDEFGITDTDDYYIKLFGFNRETVKEAQGMVLHTVKYWDTVNKTISHLDDTVAYGIGKKIVNGIVLSVNTYAYAAAAKNQFNRNKYGVIWDSKSATSNCAICQFHFKSFSLRQAMAKHHCRCCGRVVCFNCAPEKVELQKTGKFERICTECIKSGGKPPADRLAKNESVGLKGFMAATAKAGMGAAVEELTGNEDNGEENEDLEESGGEEEED